MQKPPGCQGCPFFGNGDGYVPDEITPGARVLVLLQNPGAEEEKKGKPAIGATGDLLNETLLPQAGLTRGRDVSVANALRCRYTNPATGVRDNGLPSGKILDQAIAHCRQYDRFSGHDLIVAAGGAAWKAMGQTGTISDWRGFLGPVVAPGGAQTLGVLHPADLFRDPKMKLPTLKDWSKVPHVLSGKYPRPVPPVKQVPYTASIMDLEAWIRGFSSRAVAVDTEYQVSDAKLELLGLGGSQEALGFQVWWQQLTSADQERVRDILLSLFTRVPVVFQNSMADLLILRKNVQLSYDSYYSIEDTMLAHAVLWSEWPHTLEFLASIYGKYPKMKNLSGTDPSLYNWGDVLETISTHEALEKEFERDPDSRIVYRDQSLALVPILLKSMERGLKVNKDRVRSARSELAGLGDQARLMAQAHLGWPINLGSEKHLKEYLYITAGLPVQRNKDTKRESTGADSVAKLRQLVGPSYDPDAELTVDVALSRINDGADPILESRVIYAAAEQVLSHYINPLVSGNNRIVERIYPTFKIHAQASGRWSTTDPPMAQLPADLRDIVIPDYGDVWIGWDWDQIELRLLAALANDRVYLDAFQNGYDVHVLNMCDLFGLARPTNRISPEQDLEWAANIKYEGKDDIRRVFAKRFVYRLNYGGDPKHAGDIPGVSVLGLRASDLVRASQRYLAAHPALAVWRTQVAASARSTGVSRTFLGRRRRLLGGGAGATREAYNHPMQGGVADILNLVTVRIGRELPGATLCYTMHDSAWWAVPETDFETAYPAVRHIVEDVWDVQGVNVSFPATFKKVSVVNDLPVLEKL